MLPIALSLPSGSSDSPTPMAPGGRVLSDWVSGDSKGPSILLKFRYSYKQDVLVWNMASKYVCRYYMKTFWNLSLETLKI